MPERRRITQTQSLDERMVQQAIKLKKQANLLPPGPQRDDLLRRARIAETGSRINDWISSPGLQPPE